MASTNKGAYVTSDMLSQMMHQLQQQQPLQQHGYAACTSPAHAACMHQYVQQPAVILDLQRHQQQHQQQLSTSHQRGSTGDTQHSMSSQSSWQEAVLCFLLGVGAAVTAQWAFQRYQRSRQAALAAAGRQRSSCFDSSSYKPFVREPTSTWHKVSRFRLVWSYAPAIDELCGFKLLMISIVQGYVGCLVAVKATRLGRRPAGSSTVGLQYLEVPDH